MLKFRTLSQAHSSADHKHPPTLHSLKTKWITPSYPAAPAALCPQQRWVSCLIRQWIKWWMTRASKVAWRQARPAHGPQGGVRLVMLRPTYLWIWCHSNILYKGTFLLLFLLIIIIHYNRSLQKKVLKILMLYFCLNK